MAIHHVIKGVLLATFAGCCWGSMGVAAQYLLTKCNFAPNDLTPLRMLGAGVILLAFIALRQKRNPFHDLKNLQNLRDLTVYGLSVLAMQYSFFIAIEVSNAGTAAIMVGLCPLFIMGYYILFKSRKPTIREVFCVCLALIGIVLIITRGNFENLNFSWQGAFWGVVSSLFGAINTVQPRSAMGRIGIISAVGWGMLIGGLISCLFFTSLPGNFTWAMDAVACSMYIIIFGTVIPFCCYLKSTTYIIPSVSAILNSFEPLSAVLLSIVILRTSFNICELIGGLAIISNMIILAWPVATESSRRIDI